MYNTKICYCYFIEYVYTRPVTLYLNSKLKMLNDLVDCSESKAIKCDVIWNLTYFVKEKMFLFHKTMIIININTTTLPNEFNIKAIAVPQ